MITDFVLIGDFLEVYLIELVVFIKDLADVRLSDLLQVQVEALAIQVGDKTMQNEDGLLELCLTFLCQFVVVLSLDGQEVFVSKFSECFGQEGRMQL